MSEHDDRLVRRVVEAASGRHAEEACPAAEVLGLYAERGLDGDERAGMDAHVASCARCQATVAAFVRSAPEGVGLAGAGESRAAWWTGWRWLVPVAATAAVAVVAVWVQQPAVSPDAAKAEYAAPEAAATAQAEPGRAESPAVESPAREGLTAAAPAGAAAGAGASGRRDSTAATSSGRANAGGPSRAPVASRPQAPASADFAKVAPLARADASAPAAPSAPSAAAPAARPSEERVADARERAAAAPEPAPPAVGTLQETLTVTETAEAQLRAKRQADRAEANLADAAAPPQAKAVAGSESARMAGATLAKRPALLTGRITYRTRAALPEGTVIDVRLLDVSRMDSPATLLGRVEIVTRGEQVPVPFTVGYDAAAIDPRRRYTVQATITIEGRVAYRTTTAHAVLTSGAPAAAVEIVVEPMR